MDATVQARILSTVLALGAATIAAADVASRSAVVAGWFDARRVERCRKNNWQYEYAGRFINFEQRVLLEEMPNGDYSKGSAAFIGSSVLKEAIFTNALSGPERTRIANYSWGTAVHSQEFALVRYLVEEHGFLSAGGDRSLVVIGLYYGSAAGLDTHANGGFFQEMLTYEGLYTYSQDAGIHDAPMSAMERSLRIERARISQFARNALTNWDAGLTPTWPHTPNVYQGYWRDYMGPDWRAEMSVEVMYLAEMIEYLRARNVSVVGVVLPLASWQRELPFPAHLRSLVDPLFREKGVPILDLTEFTDDADFGDSAHLAFRGEMKVSDVLLGLARRHLRRVGALPECRPDAMAQPVAHRVQGRILWEAPAGTKGIVVWRAGEPPSGEPLAILTSRSTSFALPSASSGASYVAEAYDADGCSSPRAAASVAAELGSDPYAAEALEGRDHGAHLPATTSP